jgi:VWFA-related protein
LRIVRPKPALVLIFLIVGICLIVARSTISSPRLQQLSSPSLSNFQSGKLQVLALDELRRPVTDLKLNDFQLTRYKHEVKLDSVQFGVSHAVTLGLLFDVSGSRREDNKLRKEIDATADFLRGVWRDGDVAFVVTFNGAAHLQTPPSQDVESVVNSVDSVGNHKFMGMTALYDSICSIQYAESPLLPAHRVLVVFSDFEENSSRIRLKDAIQCALNSKTQIYSIVLPEEGPNFDEDEKLFAARSLSDRTGGLAFYPEYSLLKPLSVADSLSVLSLLLRSSYEITYSTNVSPASKKPAIIGVKTTRPAVKLYVATEYPPQ